MSNLIVCLLIGALLGWIGSLVRRTRHCAMLNVGVGVGAALLIYRLATAFVGISTIGPFNLSALLIALIGAAMLLAIVNLLHRCWLP